MTRNEVELLLIYADRVQWFFDNRWDIRFDQIKSKLQTLCCLLSDIKFGYLEVYVGTSHMQVILRELEWKYKPEDVHIFTHQKDYRLFN